MKHCPNKHERGVALIMVIFMVALCSALLVSLSDSTYTAMRVNRITEQRVKAEYILKSAVNFARVLIQKDNNQFDNPAEDDWMQFQDGREVPGELVGINEPNVKISLLIAPENAKIPILEIIRPSAVDIPWRDVIYRLFLGLGFDNQPSAPSSAGNGPAQPSYTAAEMVANLIDYLDPDQDSYSDPLFQGMESNLQQGNEFPNTSRVESLQSTLLSIPGFTPAKVQQLLPYVSSIRDKGGAAGPVPRVNINAASLQVLSALIEGLDPTSVGGPATTEAQRLIQCREPANGGPYNQDYQTQITSCITPSVAAKIIPKLTAKTDNFSVIAKVEYGNASFFANALLKDRPNQLPVVQDFQVY